MDKKFKLFLYCGSSYSTLLRLNTLIPGLLGMDIEPVILFPEAPPSDNQDAYSPEMQDFVFFDRELMHGTIIPFMNAQDRPILNNDDSPKKGVCYSPKHLSQIYRVQAFALDDVNAQSHIEYIEETENLIGGVCDRGLQIFQQPTIDAFANKNFSAEEGEGKGFLWNLHPGRLPDHRGLLPVFRAAHANQTTFDITLHGIVDPTIDTGPIYGSTPIEIDTDKSILAHYSDQHHVKAGATLVFRNVADVLKYGEPRDQVLQSREEGRLYSYPSPDDIADFKQNGGTWVSSPKKEWEPIAVAFANGSQHGHGLRAAIANAINERNGKPVTVLTGNNDNNNGPRYGRVAPMPTLGTVCKPVEGMRLIA